MNKLNKSQVAQVDDIRERWTTARTEYETAQTDANAVIAAAIATLNEKIAALNAVVADANSTREEIESEMQSYADDRSEKWQESDRGSAFSDWLSSWGFEIEEVEEVEVTEIDKLDDIPETVLGDDEFPQEFNE